MVYFIPLNIPKYIPAAFMFTLLGLVLLRARGPRARESKSRLPYICIAPRATRAHPPRACTCLLHRVLYTCTLHIRIYTSKHLFCPQEKRVTWRKLMGWIVTDCLFLRHSDFGWMCGLLRENCVFTAAKQRLKTESISKLSRFNFQWTKTLYQNNLKHIAFIITLFENYRCNLLSVIAPKTISYWSGRK